MARIVPKLNLNKTPQVVDNNSLIFAKNIRLLKDNTLGRDAGIYEIEFPSELDDYTLVGYIPYNTKVYLFFNKSSEELTPDSDSSTDESSQDTSSSAIIDESSSDSGVNTRSILFSTSNPVELPDSVIYEYDEQKSESERFKVCETGWKYSGGIVEGIVTVNLRNDTLITINEYFEDFDEDDNPLIPIKTINLSESKFTDDESIYSNAPIIPVLNLVTEGTYNATIPNGVYQFFVRYEIIKDYFTSWFPCSEELFTANIYQSDTTQGTVRYMKSNVDSNESFVFSVNKLNENFDTIYKGFQIGYILSHDDTIKAKSWKKFPMTTTSIRFDYDEAYTEDIDISEIIRPVLNLYNVKNITNFKNKFYISNYIESDYNKDLAEYAKHWIVQEEAISTEGVGGYLYDTMVANYASIAYNSLDNVTKYTNIIKSFGTYSDISSIIANRNILLDNGTAQAPYPCEETQFHISREIETEDLDTDGWFETVVMEPSSTDSYEVESNLSTIDAVKNYVIHNLYGLTNDNDSVYVPYRHIVINEQYYNDNEDAIDSAGGINNFDMYLQPNELDELSFLIVDDLTPNATYKYITESDRQDQAREDFYNKIEGFDVANPSSPIVQYAGYIHESDSYIEGDTKIEKAFYFREYYTEFKITGVTRINNTNKYEINIKRRYLYKTYRYNLINSKIVRGSNFETTNVKTLIPFQSYNFYIHFVKETGEITNGYIINNGLSYTQKYDDYARWHYKLLPKFVYNNGTSIYTRYEDYKNILKQYGYSYYFFSMTKVANKVVELVNPKVIDMDYRKESDTTGDATHVSTALTFDAIDVDTLQVPLVYNIPIYRLKYGDTTEGNDYNKTSVTQLDAVRNGIYVDSGQVEDQLVTLFGASGKIVIKDSVPSSAGGYLADQYQWYIILPTQANTDNLELVKCTKYYKIVDSISNNQLIIVDQFANLQDYICTISKKVKNEYDKFISSTDYYEKSKKTIISGTNIYTIGLSEIDGYMPYNPTGNQKIYSNFNLNFLELTNDIKRLVRRYEAYQMAEDGKNYEYDENGQKIITDKGRQLTSCFDSLTLSDLYTFPSMFKNYTRRYYDVYDKESIVVYNNTLRASELEGDEEKTFVYRFLAESTYNIPTDKGIITNLISVGDAIIVHTQDSIYKFSGKVALSSADTNVQTVESDVFDTGVQEVVGSRYGFAGLRNKHHSLLSQFGYIFWDADVNVIYAYTGEGQMAPISDPINKLLNYKPITNIQFCEDYYNDRFLTQITYNDNKTVLLSYNIKAKSFVSLHDYRFVKTFNTKCNTYFTKANKLYILSNNVVGYSNLTNTNSIYPYLVPEGKATKPFAVIDIICNENYEVIKTIDSISWICSEIAETFKNNNIYLAEESLDRTYPGNYLRIYSDTCSSDKIEIVKSSNNYEFYKKLIAGGYYDIDVVKYPNFESRNITERISENYKYPRYNLGKWSFNYFRNILNNKNTNNSDNQSLIYGKYFVFRFIFDLDVNFKFENLSININNTYANN